MLVSPLPQLAWHRVSDICSRTVVPVYNALRTTLHDDVEGLAQLFVDLEVTSERGSQTYFEVSSYLCIRVVVTAWSATYCAMPSRH